MEREYAEEVRVELDSRYQICNSEGHKNPNYVKGLCGHCHRELKPSFWYCIENNPELARELKIRQDEKDLRRGLNILEKELNLETTTFENNSQQAQV